MPLTWWDQITPWDTENEKKEKERLAQEAAAQALAEQRAQERASYQAPSPSPTRKDFLSSWAEAANPKPVPTTLPVQGPQPKPTEPVSPWVDPVQAWRDSAAAQTAPPTIYDVAPQPQPEVGLAFARPDTGVAPIQATAPIFDTNAPDFGPQRQQQVPAAWSAFSDTFDRWGAQPVSALAKVTGVDTALNQSGTFLRENVPDWYTSQPAYIKAQADDAWRRSAGSNTGYDAFLDNAGQFLDQAFQVPAKSVLNAAIPGTGAALGLSGNIGISDFLGAAGGLISQSGINPLNKQSMTDAERQAIQQTQTDQTQTFYEASGIKDNLELAAQNRQLIESLPPEQRDIVRMALTSTISGAQNINTAINEILNQPAKVQALYKQAADAQQQGNAVAAADYARQAEELRNKQARDFVDDNTNIWAEIMEGIFLDPTNFVGPLAEGLGLSTEARAATKNLQLFDMTPEAAQQAIDSAMPQVQKMADSINLGEAGKGWWARVNPFALTADSQAHTSSNNIFRAAAVIFNGVTDKQEAAAIAQNLVTNPAVLVSEGVVGPGVVANPEFLRDLPIIHMAQEQIQNMRSLVGEGAFNPVEFLSELDNIVYQAARKANGLDDTLTLPTGVAKLKLRRTAGGTGVIDYLDKSGKTISSSAEMVYYNAQQELKALNKAVATVGGGISALRAHDQLQRAVMSDLWLNLRPSHWIRNAISATTTLLADNLYTLRPTDDIMEGLAARFGGALPTPRLVEGTGGVTEMTGGESIFRKLGPLGNPLAALAEAGGRIWSGSTALGPGGRVPFGEQNFYLRAFSQPFERFLNANWGRVVSEEMPGALEQLGIDPQMVTRLRDIAIDAGVTGTKADIATALREAVNSPILSPNLRELGIAPDTFSLDTWKQINGLISEGLPENVDEIGQELTSIIQRETDRLGQLINAAPPQPVRYAWTEAEQVEDGAELIDQLTNAAKRAGVDVDQAKQEVSTFVQQIINAERQALEAFRNELASNENPEVMNVAVDLWGQIDELKRVARGRVDELGQQATSTNTPDAWTKKWEGTQKIYTDLSSYIQRTIDGARTDVLAIERGEKVPRRYDFWNMVDRYLNFDELATREARVGGMDLRAPATDSAWRKVVEANRAYVDASTAEAFQAFRRYTSTDALDIVASAQKNIDRLGAQAAGYLSDLREQLAAGVITKDYYYGIRNQTWLQMFDNAVLVNKAATWEIVQDGLAKQTDTMLRWSDDFAGGEFKLIAPGNDGLWTAKRLDDGSIHQFADPSRLKPGDVASMPMVPQAVVNDYYRLAGQTDKIVEAEVADIAQEVAQTIPIPQTVDELMQMIQAGTVPPDELIPTRLVNQLMAGEAPPITRVVPASSVPNATDQAQVIAEGLTATRETLRNEWDRAAKATGLANNIDQIVATYTREGIVNVPENTFEDLYGTVIAGKKINNSTDVAAFLQDYYNLNQQAVQTIATTGVDLNELRRLANDAGIPTLSKGNRPADKRLLNTINKELGIKAKSLRELTPEQYQQTVDALARRAEKRVTQVAPAISQYQPEAAQLAQVDSYVQKAVTRAAERNNMTPQEIEQLGNQAMAQLAQSNVAIQVDQNTVDALLETGYFKTQFETGATGKGGTLDLAFRRRAEAKGLGIPAEVTADQRPVYGYLAVSDKAQWRMQQEYGGLTFVLDDSVRQRTTIAVGDSLDNFDSGFAIAAPIDAPTIRSWGHETQNVLDYAKSGNADEFALNVGHVEAQVQGGVKLSDVRAVLDPKSTLTPEQIQRLEAQGIRVVQGEAATVQNLGQAATGAAVPTMREYDATVPALDYEAILQQIQRRIQNPYELQKLAGDFNPWGLLGDVPQDFRNVLRAMNDGVVNTRQVTPEVGDAAHYMVTNAQKAYQRIMEQLPELLAGTPNQMTGAQQLRAIDYINSLAAKHDDILAAAVKTGQDVADFAMLNYNQRRNFDVLLQLAIPYHYFWSRSAANWARRVAEKPALANFYYEIQRGIDAQNQRDNIPQHLQGTIGIPGTDLRIANPLPYMMPFMSYAPSSFVDPNEAQTETGRWVNTVLQWTPGLLPTLDLARKYFVEGNLSGVSLGSYVPQYKLGGYAYQAATGNIMQGPMSYTDPYEYGRAGKQVSLANVRGEIDKNTALWGQDVGLQQQTGAAPLPEQPAGAADVWRQGAQASGWDRLLTTGAGYLTGLGLYPYRPEEQQIRAISGIRKDLGYDENSNLYGSQGAVNAFDEATGEVTDPYYAYRQLYPQDGSGYGQPVRPGEQAVNAEKKAAKAAINTQMGKDLDEYLKLNPDATNSDIYNFKRPYYDQIDALDQKFPSATQYPDRPPVTTDATGYSNYAPTDFYNNYSPEELLATAQEAAVYQAREELAGQKPVYPEGGTKEQINQYYKDKATYDAALETRVQEYLDSPNLLSSLVNARSVLPGPARPGEQYNPPPARTASPLFPELGVTGWDATKIKPVSPGQGAPSAADIIRQVDQGGQTDAEKAQREKNAKIAEDKRAAGKAKYEQSQAEWAARRGAVTGYFGEGGAKMWDEYYNLPKGEARAEFMRNNPTMRAINLYAYNRAELQPGLDLLGDDAFGLWALAPAYGESPEAKAARSKYWDDNPKAFLFNSWLNGRPGPGGEGSQGGESFSYNFGADYSQALELFGPDIWTVVEGYKRSWNKDIKRSYYDKHPQLSAFFDWWYGNGDGSVSAAGAGRSAGGGYRSYGGGGGGGYYDYSEQKRETPVNIQMPYSHGLSNALAAGGTANANWRPSQADIRWLDAGRNLAPGKPRKGDVTWIRKTGGTY